VTVANLPGNYLGPILRVKSGTKLRIFFHNNLAEDSVIHPHGLRVPENCDGQPMQAIGPGLTKVYEFQVIDRAGPYWFHPHPHMRTAEQVVMGWRAITFGMMKHWLCLAPVVEQRHPGYYQDRVCGVTSSFIRTTWGHDRSVNGGRMFF
jgi:hypothetical protein